MLMSNKNHNIRFAHEETRKMGLLLSDDGKIEKINEWAIEDRNKLEALCDYYGISDTSEKFYELSLALARDFLPEKKKRGVKTKWTELVQAVLVAEVDRLVSKEGTDRDLLWAFRQLSETSPWCEFIKVHNWEYFGNNPSEVIRKHYYKSQHSQWALIARDALKYHEINNDLDGWNNFILLVVKGQTDK
jgi:hypothetical protein